MGAVNSQRVHVIFILPNGNRAWFARTDRRQDSRTGVTYTVPLADDDPRQSRTMPYEAALIAQRRWREELNLNCRLALEPYGEFLDDAPDFQTAPWPHVDHFVHSDESSDLGYLVRAVCTRRGKEFCLVFRNPELAAQSIFVPLSEGPAAAVEKARMLGWLRVEPPYERPDAAERRAARETEAQRQAQAEHVKKFGRRRPGDL